MDKRITDWLPANFTEEARMSKADKKYYAKKKLLDEIKELANRKGVGNGGTLNFLTPIDLKTRENPYELTAIEFDRFGSPTGIFDNDKRLHIPSCEEWRLERIINAIKAL